MKKIIRFIKDNWYIILLTYAIYFFGLICAKSIIVNAYSLNEEGNIVSDNLYNETNQNVDLGTWDVYIGDFYFEPNTTYSIKSFDCSTGGTNFFIYYNGVSIQQLNENWIKQCDVTFTTNSDITYDHSYKLRMSGTYNTSSFKFKKVMQVLGSTLPTSYEPYGIWLSDTNVDNLLSNSLNISSVSASWSGGSLSNASSYIYNKDGLVWVDGVFDYIDGESLSSYSDADVSVVFGARMPTNVNYSYSFIDSIGSSISFYQGNTRIYSINVTDDINNLCSSVPTSNLCVINLADKIDVKQYTYFDRVVLWSSNYDHRPLSFGYYSSSFYSGYNKGYSDGYDLGYSNGSSSGYNNGYKRGYDVGFDAGVLHQESNGPNTLVGMVSAIFSAPVTMFQMIFDFNFLGINLSDFFFSLISLLIVVWLIIKFL